MTLVCRIALRPNATDRKALSRSAWARRLAFNAALAWHRAERAAGRAVPGEYPTAAWLRDWRKATAVEKPDLLLVAARVFEYAAEDLERAWKAAQRNGAGRPRFERFDPLAGGFKTDGAVVVEAGRLKLPRLGAIRIAHGHRDRPAEGTYTYAHVTRAHGEWFVSLPVTVSEAPVVDVLVEIGLDVGVRKLGVLSDGTRFENPKALERVARRANKARLAIARKRRAADKKHGPWKEGERREESKRLGRERRKLGRALGRAADIRKDAIHQATTTVARRYQVVAVEDLRVKNMTRRVKGKGRAAKASLNRRILDAAPGMFLRMLDYKLRLRGGRSVPVNPAYTSQDCSRCGARHDPGDSETYTCATCGSVMDRDDNGAKNILARARSAAAGWTAEDNARGAVVRPPGFGPAADCDEPRIVRKRAG